MKDDDKTPAPDDKTDEIECACCGKMTPRHVDEEEWWCTKCGWDGLGRPWLGR